MMIRLVDITLSIFAIIVSLPVSLIISICIILESKGGVFYVAKRVGINESEFLFIKFRTMRVGSDKTSITIGDKDSRITRIGLLLRKTKLDELPQFINVILGQISIVGPRPDVAKYRDYYKNCYNEYYSHKPGITCFSSIFFRDESNLYIGVENPELKYTSETIPQKVKLDLEYFNNKNLKTYIQLILKTIIAIIKK